MRSLIKLLGDEAPDAMLAAVPQGTTRAKAASLLVAAAAPPPPPPPPAAKTEVCTSMESVAAPETTPRFIARHFYRISGCIVEIVYMYFTTDAQLAQLPRSYASR